MSVHDSSLKKSTVLRSVQPSMVVVVDVVEPDVATRPASSTAAAAAAAAAAARFTGDPARPGPQFLARSTGEGEGGWFPAPQPLLVGLVAPSPIARRCGLPHLSDPRCPTTCCRLFRCWPAIVAARLALARRHTAAARLAALHRRVAASRRLATVVVAAVIVATVVSRVAAAAVILTSALFPARCGADAVAKRSCC
eukprot:scaffold36016_cov37-Phaeocystis_antarctica.AAC.1